MVENDTAPGPRGLHLMSILPDFAPNRILGAAERLRKHYGDVVRFRVGPREWFFVSHPDLAQRVLVADARKFPKSHEGAKKPLGMGLLLGDGLLTARDHESWLARRRAMQPEFHRQRIASMANEMAGAGERMLDRWERSFSPGDTFDLHGEMTRLTLDVVNRTMFSADVADEAEEVGSAATVAARFIFTNIKSPVAPPLWVPTQSNREFHKAVATIDHIVLGMVRARRAAHEAGEESRGDLLDMLLHSRNADTGERIGEQEVLDEAKTIFATGHETTANTLTWTFHLLARNPEADEKLRAELDEVLGDRPPIGADLPNLPYTRRVFDEALRLYPPVPFVPRRVAETTELGGYEIPAGSSVVVNIYSLHRHPGFWPESDAFAPDRFSPERKAERHREAYAPFGAGQRMCIGNNFSLMEGPLLLALISQRYEIGLAPGHPVEREVALSMRPKDGLYATAYPRA